MSVVVVGISHKTAPVEWREKLSVLADRADSALAQLSKFPPIAEVVFLSTCNRVEVYARARRDLKETAQSIRAFFREIYGKKTLSSFFYTFENEEAVHHLFRVSCGLDSLVVGEAEILGQVKTAYLKAQAGGTTGKITNVMFQRALYIGKQVRTETRIGEGSSSVGSIAVRLAGRIFGSLSRHRVLLLGAGKMAEVTARQLLSQKAGMIVILNRTRSKAEKLAKILNGRAGTLDDLEKELSRSDIVICSVASSQPLIPLRMVKSLMEERRGRSLYFIDIAVPRNVEGAIHQLDNVYVYNIDDLKSIVDENMAKRLKEVNVAEGIVGEMAKEFKTWMKAALAGESMGLKHHLLRR